MKAWNYVEETTTSITVNITTTKYRRNIINEGLWAYLERKLLDIPERYPQIFFKIMNQDKDHVYLLASIPPTMSVGAVVRLIKSNTSRKIKEQFPFLREIYWGTDGIWSDGYFVSTAGIRPEIIQRIAPSIFFVLTSMRILRGKPEPFNATDLK
ncbi:MAG: IS200/IS605 family transposase [Patescibacteria group bacterium]|nr:IS200/IS605 family transposase [Patescibacteria group bacterium]